MLAPDDLIIREHDRRISHGRHVGTGVDCSIRQLAQTIADVTGFAGRVVWDETKPDAAPRKMLDISRLSALGWRARIGFEQGLRSTYDWYLKQAGAVRGLEP